jgi:hypothetical protein
VEIVSYRPPGKVGAQFHADNSFVRGLMGPVGSGKSSTCCVEIVARALAQAPSTDGVRRSRWAIIRNTYPELKSTTIKTWQTWFPDNIAPIKWDTPITSTMNIADIGDGTALELEVLFLALDRATETGKLRSLELTGAWMNEASEIPREIFDMLTQRVGRYPSKLKGGPSWSGVIMDTNPPDDDSWYYKFAEEETPESWKFFRQPGGLFRDEHGVYQPNPDAENIFNLPNGHQYYLNQVAGKNDDWVNVFLLGNYGTTADGKPVYPEYKDKIHVSPRPLEPMRGLPIILGWDFGLTPACVIMQVTPRGQVMVLKELVSEDMGIRQFANEIVKPVLMNEFAGFSRFSCGDPAGNIRAQTDERTCYQELLEAGIPSEPAPTNDFIPRREAVAFFLTRLADGQSGFILDPSCRQLRRGFIGRYRYERLRTNGSARYRDRPVKDDHSHIHDALQYACLRIRSGLNPVRAKAVSRPAAAKGWY